MANLLDEASILLTPTAYNNGSMLAVKPENGDGDFTFSRNSAATRVNAQGLVENVQILSSNLVSNGDFSQEGAQEVSNGSFSQEGSEQVTNGNFATDTDWDKLSGATISSGQANLVFNGLGNPAVKQNIPIIQGKTYKIVFNVSRWVSGKLEVYVSGDTRSGFIVLNGVGQYEVILKINTVADVRFVGNGVASDFSIDNVSVKEVGQDWDLSGDAQITENSCRIYSPSGGYSAVQQLNLLTIGKTYKLSIDITENNGGLIRVSDGTTLLLDNISSVNTYTKYFTATDTKIWVYRNGITDISISNISVKEVGQNWTLETGWSIGDSVANATLASNGTSLYQNASLIIGNLYEITYEIKNFVSGEIVARCGNTFGAFNSSNGIYKEQLVCTSGSNIVIRTGANTTATVTNISVIEITDDTNLPRINYEGFSYQDALGSEEVVNGDFATDTNWIKNGQVTIGGGVAYFDSDGTFTQIAQSISGVSGKNVKVVIEITEYTQGTLKVLFSGGTQQNLPNSVGVHTLYFNNADSDTINIARLGGVTNLKIDNVSVKEYLGQEVVPNSGCGSWLLEPQSTNLIPYSEDFSQFNAGNVTIEDGYSSPDGGNNAYKVTRVSGTSPSISFNASLSSTETRTIWARTTNGTGDVNLCSYYQNTNNLFTITEDWQRFEVNGNTTSAGESNFYAVDFRGSTTITEVIIWGAQAEQLSYPTSYIPTSGAASTRLKDIATNSGNASLINSEEGVLYAELAALSNDGTTRRLAISDGSTSNRVFIGYDVSTNSVQFVVSSGGSVVVNQTFTISDTTQFNKLALKYKLNDCSFWIDGVEVGTDTTALMPIGLNEVMFNQGTTSRIFYGKNKALAVYKTALTDASLRSLTYPPAVATTFDLNFNTIADDFTFTRGSEATFVNAQGLIQSTNEIGSELVTNGDFTTDSANWFLTGTSFWVNSSIEVPTGGLTQVFTLENNKTYKITFDVIQGSGINGGVYVNTNYNSPVFADNVGVTTTGVGGTYTFIFTMNGSGNGITLTRRVNNQDIRIDNVSVKEYTTATNTPRLDYSTGSEAFLLEPQSTNLVTQSEDFSNVAWTKLNSTIVSSQEISPNGSLNADRLNILTNTWLYSPSTASNGYYSVSVFAKAGDISTFKLGISDNVQSELIINVDLSNETFTTEVGSSWTLGDAKIENYGNGWYRCSISGNNTVTSTSKLSLIRGVENGYIYIWGAQLEQNSFSTSYIPTSGASATRNQELCTNATPVINSEEGTLYFEGSALADDGTFRLLSFSDGTSVNRVYIGYSSVDKITCSFQIASSAVYGFDFTTDINVNSKFALKYKENDFALWVNGVEVNSQSSGNTFPIGTLTKMQFTSGTVSSPFYGNTKDLKYYPKALADVQLQDLTTL